MVIKSYELNGFIVELSCEESVFVVGYGMDRKVFSDLVEAESYYDSTVLVVLNEKRVS